MRYLLIQIRDDDDPMRRQEVECFRRALQAPDLGASPPVLLTHDLLGGPPSLSQLDDVDAALIGGSGNYSVVEGGKWLPDALAGMRQLVDVGKPMFASCWGFQALAKALGGEVVTDISLAEVGTHKVFLTDAGKADQVMASAGDSFDAQMGHQDIVVKLPKNVEHLARTERVENQAFKIIGKPIYATQFHPELLVEDLMDRVTAYPQYVREITGESIEQFEASVRQSHACQGLLREFVRQHVIA